jgi:hypothetical protein
MERLAANAKHRLDGLDVLKGLLLIKLCATHVGTDLGAGFASVTHLFGNWTFGTFLFAFGLGVGLSSRPPRAMLFLTLVALYFGQAVLTLALHPSPTSAREAMDLITLAGSSKYVGFLLPYIVFSGLRVWAGARLFQIRPVHLAIGSIAAYGLGLLGHQFAPEGPGSVLWGHFGPLTHAPLIAAGYLAAPWFKRTNFAAMSREKANELRVIVGLSFLAVGVFAWSKYVGREDFRGSGGVVYLFLSAALAFSLIVTSQAIVSRFRRHCTGLAQVGRNSLAMMAVCTVLWNVVDTDRFHHMGNLGGSCLAVLTLIASCALSVNGKRLAESATTAIATLRAPALRERLVLESTLASSDLWSQRAA